MAKAGLGAEAAKPKLQFKRSKRGANLSRKKIFDTHRKAWEVKQKKLTLEKQEAKKARVERIQKQHNKKANKTFDRAVLRVVQDGLTSAISALGEQVSPLSLFMGAFTALSKSPEKHQVPYMLAILSACVPRLSQGVLMNRLEPVFSLCEQLIAENATSNHLITAKAMKLAQIALLCVERPSMEVIKSFGRLEPSKAQVELMQLYLATLRKLLEQSALSATNSDAGAPMKNPNTELYSLSPLQMFYVEALPEFVSICANTLLDSPATLAVVTMDELTQLFRRSLSPYIVESHEGTGMINALLSSHLPSFLKPMYQQYWGIVLGALEAFGSRLSYLKRVHQHTGDSSASLSFCRRFPGAVFVLKVLNKLRQMDDTTLNAKIERAMIEFAKGMRVEEFVEILPFNPCKAYALEVGMHGPEDEGDEETVDPAELWATSYTLGIIRRAASHDSLPFYVKHFFPMIQYMSRLCVEAERADRPEEFARLSALLMQLWRVAVGFCHYPIEITNDSFRELAKQLVGLLSNDTFVDTSATALHVLCDGYYRLSQAEQLDDDDDDANGGIDDAEVLEQDMRVAGRVRGRHIRKEALDEDDVFLSMNDPDWNPHRYHNITQARAAEVCTTILAKYSANIMPKLCNVFETHDSTAVVLAIQSFSKVCKPEVMTTILNGILEVGSNIAAHANVKAAEQGSGKAGHAPLTSKRRMVLDIACAVVAQLPAEHVTRLFNDVIEPVLMDPAPESRLLQKKAYKLLFSLFEYRVKDVFPLFPRIVGILSIGRQHVTISGVKMRIRCLSWSLDACKMYYPDELTNTIRALIPEIILFSRERSSETRTMTMEVLEKMQRYMVAAGAPSNALLRLVIAGLSGKTPMMISSALVCMAKLVYLTHLELPEADLNGAVNLGFRLMESTMIEVRTAAAIFARMTLKLMKRSRAVAVAVAKSLSALLYAIALVTSQPRVSSTTRVQMRVLLEKCIKRCGYERIDPIFPLGSKNFLRYTHKMMKREEKKEERALKKRKEAQQNEFDKLFLGVSMKAGAVDGEAEDLLEAGALTNFVSRHTAPTFQGLSVGGGLGGGEYGAEEDDDYDVMHLDFQDGKLRIISKEEKTREDEHRRRLAVADKLLRRHNGFVNAETINDMRSRPGKRSRSDDAEAEDLENDELVLRYGKTVTEEAAQKVTANFIGAGRGTNAPRLGSAVVGPSANQISKLRDQKAVKQTLKRQRVEEDIRKGDEFQGTGTGDVRRGNVEPFAYVPLNRRYMNRRNARQALHRFEVVSNKHLKGEKAKMANESKRRS